MKKAKVHLPEGIQSIIAGMDHSLSHTFRGIVDNAAVLNGPLPATTAAACSAHVQLGNAFGVTTAPGDFTSPRAMQEWWLQQVKGAVMLEMDDQGYGHLYQGLIHELIARQLRFLKNGKDD